MPDNNPAATPATQNEIRESTCIHTKKIYDSCQAKDCVEDLRLYPLLSSQATIDSAMSLRAGRAELLHVYMDVQPVGLGRGYYSVDLRFFYKVTAEATAGCARSARVTGLAIFDKRSMLFGSEGRAKRFTSDCACQQLETTLPGVQVYTAGFLGERRGKGGALYGPRHAVCLETQYFPDAVNQPSFPSPVLRAGESYRQRTVYRFRTEP